MEIKDFIECFHTVFDETDIKDLTPATVFRDLDEWSSLHALATMTLLDQRFGKKISAEKMKAATTIQDLYNIANS